MLFNIITKNQIMKRKFLLILSLIFTGFLTSYAQTLVSTEIEKKNVVLEEYTGIHCQYCPQGHAIAQGLYDANPYDVVLINIHTGGFAIPSGDEPDYRTTFGDEIATDPEVLISGYPAGSVNRHIFDDLSSLGGTAMGRGSWEAAAGRILIEDSPVNVGAETSYNDVTRELTVNVELYYTSDAPVSSNFLNVALVQNGIIGPQQDGGTFVTDYEHNHMFRDLLTGQWGEEITTTTSGTFVERTYVYSVPDDFLGIPCIVEDCDIAVFVTEDHQEIYSGIQIPAVDGTTYVIGTFSNPAEIIQQGSDGNTSTFSFDFTNGFPTPENFTFTISNENEPDDWSSSFSIDGIPFTTTGTFGISGGGTEDVTIDITPTSSAGYVKYILTVVSDDFPEYQEKKIEVYVIANVGTLLLHNAGSWGDGNPIDFEDEYFAGFDYASVPDYASCSYSMYNLASANNVLGDMHTMFYNVAWTFPGINEEITSDLTNFLDNGGNLFIAGQDLGWDTWENTGTTITQTFYTNYLNAEYQGDGSTANNSVFPNPEDGVFGDLNSSDVINVYGGTNMYPDEMSAVGYGSVILNYLDNPNKGAAIKATNGDYKVVYLGFDPPMVSDIDVRNEIFKRSIDWFNGILATNASFNPAEGSIDVPVNTEITINFDQGIRNLDDSEINNSNLASVVTFEDAELNPVAFTGTINSEKTQIVLTPDMDLDALTDYTVSVFDFENDNDVAGVNSSSTFTTEELIGVKVNNKNDFSVYPNPAESYLNIILNENVININITDINGKIVVQEINISENKQTIDISELMNGVYFVNINTDNETVTKKFVIVR